MLPSDLGNGCRRSVVPVAFRLDTPLEKPMPLSHFSDFKDSAEPFHFCVAVVLLRSSGEKLRSIFSPVLFASCFNEVSISLSWFIRGV